MTYLEIINEVMKRLREPEVTSSSAARYTKLIGALVNDSKRAVEDSTDWTALLDTVEIITSAGTSDYALTGASERASVFSVTNAADRAVIARAKARDTIALKQVNPGTGKPDRWSIIGVSSGVLQIRFYPTPDAAYTYSVNCVLPQDDLEDDGDTLSIPWEPVVMRSFAYAIKERGEDQGQAFNEALDQYRRVLSRYLVLNNTAKGGGGVWQVR